MKWFMKTSYYIAVDKIISSVLDAWVYVVDPYFTCINQPYF